MKQSQFYYLLRRGLFGGGGIWAKYVNDFKARVISDGGTLESTACITSDVKYLVKNPIPVPAPSFDTDYQAVLDYATTQGYTAPSASQQTLQNTLVTDLKTAGVWSKLDVFYMFATDGDSDFATLNWKAPSSHQVTKVNSPTFTSNEGYNGDGSSSYLDTNLSVANATNYTRDNASFGFYFYQFASTGYDFGLNSGSILRYRSRAATRHRLNSLTNLSKTFGTSNGFQGMTRPNSTAARFIEPSGIISSDLASNTSFIPPTANFTIFSYNNANFSNSKMSMFFVGGNLESSNAADFHDAIDTYISAL